MHLWKLHCQAKFFLEHPRKTRRIIGRYSAIVIDLFVEEALACSHFIAGDWRSEVLKPILLRAFHHMVDSNLETDFEMVAHYLGTTGKGPLNPNELIPADFLRFYSQGRDVLQNKYRNGAYWISRFLWS